MVDTTQLLQELKSINKRLDEQSSSIADLKQGQAQTNTTLSQTNTTLSQIKTVVETLEAGQKDIREELSKKADKTDIQDLDAKLVKMVKKHEDRLDALEEHTGTSNPHKN